MIGALALAAACRAIETILPGAVAAHESALLDRLTTGLDRVAGVTVLRLWSDVEDHVGLVSFTVDGFASELVAQYLSAEHGIGV
ncbi:MAG: hypothetical protein QOI39_13, partial [Mycobacterium sp.]|nr:hypothetical protein [Mycobacterium sp.]